MEIKKENKFKKLFKRYGALSLACVLSLVIAFSIGLSLSKDDAKDVSTGEIQFAVPMTNAVIVKDYADDHLQFNESLNRWEIHLAIDMMSEDKNVMSILEGTVASVECNSLDGCVITINHSDGFVSVYSSLEEDALVAQGDKVSKGQLIGKAAATATNESLSGGHLHFQLFKDGKEVDPNNYLDLQNK